MPANLLSGVPSSNVSTLMRSNSGGAGLRAVSCAVSGTRVTSVEFQFAVNVTSKRPAASVGSGQFSTTSTPSVVGVDAVDEEASAACSQ